MWEILEQAEQLVDQYFEDSSAVRVNAEAIGLDNRAGSVFVSTEECWIAVVGSTRQIDYYGGFEYIDIENRLVIGDATFFCDDSDRVAEALEYYHDNQGEE
tara:strand:+ start:50 stop:352 length:303 start_codon:yes stop_codon:yes gene_type:complete